MSSECGAGGGHAIANLAEGHIIAVCIGVNQYESGELEPLENAVADAESVATAIEQTQRPGHCRILRVLSSGGEVRPTKVGILRVLREAGELAKRGDTVVLFFAGHGRLVDGRPVLVPEDGESNAIFWEDVEAAFEHCLARQRLLMLDACQLLAQAGSDRRLATPARGVSERGVRWRSRGGLSGEFVEGLGAEASGWVVLTACGPGQMSVECDDHGLFSYRVAAGLRGEADLDGDGVVGLGELVQYVAKHVAQDVSGLAGVSQNPTVLWRGSGDMALTRLDGLPEESRPADFARRRKPGRGFWRVWTKRALGRWRYENIRAAGFVRYGFGLLWGVVLAAEVLVFAGVSRPAYVVAAAVGLGSVVVWLATVGFSLAACERRWHGGGYVTGIGIAVWHLLVFGLVSRVFSQRAASPLGVTGIALAIDLFAIGAVVIVLGVNGFQFILSVADLLSRGERVPVQSALLELGRTWVHARLPNVVAMQSIHPALYLLLFGGGGGAILLWHVGSLLWSGPVTGEVGITVVRDLGLLVLVWAQAGWYQAAYSFLSGQVRPKV